MPHAGDEAPSAVRRVLVVGGPGSGKTTFARHVASVLHLPHHELDRIAHDPPARDRDAPFTRWRRASDDDRRDRAAALAATDAWVADGLYAGWTAALRDAADVVVWLDLPVRVTVGRVVRRALSDRRRGGRDWDVRSAFRVAWGARGFRSRPAATAEQLRERDGANGARTLDVFLRPVAERVIRCRTTAEVGRTVDQVTGGPRRT